MKNPRKRERVYLDCACCGRGFHGWQNWNRDTGYGICADAFCANAYGYHTQDLLNDDPDYVTILED